MNVGNLGSPLSASLLALRRQHTDGRIVPASSAPTSPAPSAPTPSTDNTNPLTLEGFRRSWGTADPTYDLNADGSVDINDVSQWIVDLMNEITGGADPSSPDADPPSPLTTEGFTRAWGTSDPGHDLNNDASVNIDDLTQWVLNQSNNAGQPSPQPEPLPDPQPGAVTAEQPAPAPALENIDNPAVISQSQAEESFNDPTGDLAPWHASWGTSGPFDYTGDGTVNIDDLTQWILGQSGANTHYKPIETTPLPKPAQPGLPESLPAGPAPAPVPVSSHDHRPERNPVIHRKSAHKPAVPAATLLERLEKSSSTAPVWTGAARSDSSVNISKLAARIINKLQSDGFKSAPPGNINKLLDGLDLDRADRRALARQIAAAYPHGLGVNAIG